MKWRRSSYRLQWVTALTLCGTYAHAVSFDCSKASTTVEHAICDDPRLGDLDSQLAKQLKDLLQTGPSARAALLTEERKWLAFRDGCPFGTGPSRQELAGCLVAAYRARITQLKARGCVTQSFRVLPSAIAGLIDQNHWNMCAMINLERGHGDPHATAVLLKSKAPIGKDGFGQPFYGVDLLLTTGARVMYRYTKSGLFPQHFVDDLLEVRDLSGRGDRSIVFHAGIVNAGDFAITEHVVYAPPGSFLAKDVASETFWDSPRRQHLWTVFGSHSLVLVAEPIEPVVVDDPHMCQSCPKYYQYLAYQWEPERRSFRLIKLFPSRRDFYLGADPLQADWPLIEGELAQVALK
jgi:uncharacterized protein YecT (DUF1311 family)